MNVILAAVGPMRGSYTGTQRLEIRELSLISILPNEAGGEGEGDMISVMEAQGADSQPTFLYAREGGWKSFKRGNYPPSSPLG
jgi:hypothetical protein